jgi:hypothetical protein
VEVTPKNDGLIDPVQLLKATYDSGVSVAEMSMLARGQVVKGPTGGIALQVQPSKSFVIEQNNLSKELESLADSQRWVTVRAQLYKKQTDQKKKTQPAALTVTILEIQQKE